MVLWVLFAVTILLSITFRLIADHWQIPSFLDAISSPEDARGLLGALTDEQKRVHVWTTSVVDVVYPLVYGCFFAGVALSCFRHFGLLLAIPSFLVIPVDILEGVVQVYALLGLGDFLDWKALLTPAKFGLFFLGFGIAILGWCNWALNKFKQSRQ